MISKSIVMVNFKEAMKQKDKRLVSLYRDIINNINEFEKENKSDINSQQLETILTKMVKKRNQSIEAFEKANRQDLVDSEQFELDILKGFLPKELSEVEIESIVSKCIANGLNNIGPIMKYFKDEYPGQNGKVVSNIVRKLLN